MTESTGMAGAERKTEGPVRAPSVAYGDAIISPVYRLSELMFGSLLASYVLGFIGFAAASSGTSSNDALDRVLTASTYLFISVTYAYVTAGQYVSYHAGILTMHHMPLGQLRYDFMLALSQAVAFGIAMLYPVSFPATLGFTYVVAVWRQHREHKAHVDAFFREQHGYRTDFEALRQKFELKFNTLLKNKTEYGLLSGWESAPRSRLWQAVALLALSVIAWLVIDARSPFSRTLPYASTLSAVSFLVFAVVVRRVHGILKDNASLLLDLGTMNEQFDRFVKEL